MSNLWRSFWKSYNNIEPVQEDDLYIQVGKTNNKKPISKEIFENIVTDIAQKLELKSSDILLEMCCGNGLFTHSLSNTVKYIYAFDFTESLIDTAKKYKSGSNIEYVVGDAKQDFTKIFRDKLPVIQKFLMNDTTAYFSPEDLSLVIERIYGISEDFRFYLTNIPNNEKKWDFYNTPERKEKYLHAVQTGDIFLGGIGRWWEASELSNIAKKHSLKLEIQELDNEYSYRFNALFYI